jgi:hypothetical protein
VKLFQECPKGRRKVVVLESCDADNLIRNEIQLQLFHRYNLAIQLDIPETMSLNLLIFGLVNLNDEENNAVFKSVQSFIIKSKRCTP